MKKLSFLKKKKFYIVLVVLFSLILLADLAVGIFVPTQNVGFGGMSGGRGNFDISEMGEMPDMSEMGEMPDMSEMGEMPDMSEMGEMPDMSEMGEMPGMSEMGEISGRSGRGGMPGTSEDGETSDGASDDGISDSASSDEISDGTSGDETSDTEESKNTSSDMMEMWQNGETTQSSGSFLQAWKSHWIVIFVVFFILDAVSIVMLVLISRKEKQQRELEEAKYIEEHASDISNEVHLQRKPKKEKHRPFMGIILLAAMVLLVVIIKILTAQNGEEIPQTEASVYSGTAEIGSVSSVLPGTGTLTDETAVNLEIPSEVEITRWYVSNGDTVSTGDKLAQVDTVSVMSAIVSVQEKLALLDEELEEHENDEISDTIEATADGRIKVIYVEDDADVVETMYNHGALMRISLDGLMAVSLETDADISAGDLVTVTLEDDTELSGKVESIIDGVAVITVSDEDTEYDETVTVTTEDGTKVGTGKLYIHSELKVTGFTGTISDVEVSVEEEVTSGETLLSLTDTDYTGEYEALLAKRSELESYMQSLFQMYQDQYIYASCDGVISGLDSSVILAATGSTETVDAGNTAETADAGDTADTTESADAGDTTDTTETADVGNTTDTTETADAGVTETSTSTKNVAVIQTMSCKSTGSNGGMMTLSSSDAGSEPMAAAEPVTTSEVTTTPEATATPEPTTTPETDDSNDGDGTTTDPTTTPEATVTPDADNTGGTTPNPDTDNTSGTTPNPDAGNGSGANDSYTNYIGTVSAVTIDGANVIIQLTSVNGPGTNNLSIPASSQVYAFASGKYMASRASDIQVGNMLMVVYESGNSATPIFCILISGSSSESTGMPDGADMSQDSQSQNSQGQDGASAQMPSGSTGGTSAGSSSADSAMYSQVMETLEEEVQNDYGVTTTVWLSVIPQETMDITITVDEMDILSLEVGQEALVTVDAFPGQSFAGTVTAINLNGTNSGGSSKYEAVISIAREENMLSGMNASVQITLDTQENVLIIPEAALVEEESGVYVYTSYDEKTETFGDLVEVTTGVSDGENVEILSGLSEGSEYWYSYLDVVNYSTASFESGSFSMNSLFGGGRR